MAETERAIFANMCMVYDDSGNVLVQERADSDWSGIAFPGGHVELCESFTDAVIREVWEETGLTIKNPILCGIKQFWTKDKARYVVLLYRTNEFSGELRSSEEGEVFWIKRSELESRTLAKGFIHMLEVMEDAVPHELFYLPDSGELVKK